MKITTKFKCYADQGVVTPSDDRSDDIERTNVSRIERTSAIVMTSSINNDDWCAPSSIARQKFDVHK